MKLELLGRYGPHGLSERLAARAWRDSDWRDCEVRWVSMAHNGWDPDLNKRALDVAGFLRLVRDPMLPRVWSAAELDDGVVVVVDRRRGQPLSALPRAAWTDDALLSLLWQVGDFLDRLHNLPDPVTCMPLHVLVRALTADDLLLSPDGTVQLVGLDAFRAVWADRLAKTGDLARPGDRLAPEQLTGHDEHRTDVYLLAHAALGLRAPDRADRGAPLALAGAEFDAAWDRLLGQVGLGLSAPLRALLTDALRFDPTSRPTACELAERAAELGGGPGALEAIAGATPFPDEPWDPALPIELDRTLELPDPPDDADTIAVDLAPPADAYDEAPTVLITRRRPVLAPPELIGMPTLPPPRSRSKAAPPPLHDPTTFFDPRGVERLSPKPEPPPPPSRPFKDHAVSDASARLRAQSPDTDWARLGVALVVAALLFGLAALPWIDW